MRKKPKIKIKEPSENFDFMKATKDNLKNVVRDENPIEIITPFSLKNGTLFSKKNIIAPFQA